MWDVLTGIVIKSAAQTVSKIAVSKAFDYAENKFFSDDDDEFLAKLTDKIIEILREDPSILNLSEDRKIAKLIKVELAEDDDEYEDINLDFIEDIVRQARKDFNESKNLKLEEIINQVIKILNCDGKILNNPDDKNNAEIIKSKISVDNPAYNYLNTQTIENIISQIRENVKIRVTLSEEFKKCPQIIKEKISAIIKTVCANLEIDIDENLKTQLSNQIYIIKKIYELHKNDLDKKQISFELQVLEFEVKRFAGIFKDV